MNVAFVPAGAANGDPAGHQRALILPGGGLRLSYAAGVLEVLLEHGLTFGFMDGTSGGSLNLAMLLSGQTPAQICQHWRQLKMRKTISLMSPGNYLWPPCFVAGASGKAFRQKVYPALGIDFDKIRSAQGVQASFNLCHFASKTNRVFPHQQISEDHLLAGMSLPAALPPVDIDGEQYLDSGFIQDANLLDQVKAGARELWLIWIMGNLPEYRSGPLNAYVQMLELSANGALGKELRQLDDINQRIAAGETVYGHREPIVLHLIKPAQPLPLDSALYTGAVSHDQLIAMGQADARAYLQSMQPQGVALQPEVLQMTRNKPGLQFKETMKGGFALQVTEPAGGLAQGRQAGTELAMHAAVGIDQMAAFIDDPQHLGTLSGTIDFPPLGMGIPAPRGVFNLFKPTDNPELTLMVYELGFEWQGQSYYLAGRKEVRDGSILKLWPETTTLYTQLHQGTDKSGPVIGAGILSLGVIDLLKLLSTVTVTHADGFSEKVGTIGAFAGFFSKQLWATYVSHQHQTA